MSVSSSDIRKGKVLIVDDERANILLIEQLLRGAGYVAIESTTDPNVVCELHRENRYDLILLDIQMPGVDGFQVMDGLKQIEDDRYDYLPVLVLAAEPEHKLRALQAGAKDFLSKPFDLAEVLARVHNMLEVRLLHRALEEASLTDPLTGLRNRRFLHQHIEGDSALTLRRYDDWLAAATGNPPEDADLLFFLVDIDQFKAVNDELGHHAGDNVLAQIQERLQQVFRESDYLVRWGGEEFLAVTRGTPRSDAGEIAERARNAFANRTFALDNGQTLAKSASIGFAAFPFIPSAPHALNWSQVVELADHALYIAKRGGRNAWSGLTATERTEPSKLARQLAISPDDVVHAAALEVLHPR